jgi:hypothetical protein
MASRFNAVNVTPEITFGEVTVQAGELTIYAIDAEVDEIRPDKDDVILGKLKIVNVAGRNLELDDVIFNLDLA